MFFLNSQIPGPLAVFCGRFPRRETSFSAAPWPSEPTSCPGSTFSSQPRNIGPACGPTTNLRGLWINGLKGTSSPGTIVFTWPLPSNSLRGQGVNTKWSRKNPLAAGNSWRELEDMTNSLRESTTVSKFFTYCDSHCRKVVPLGQWGTATAKSLYFCIRSRTCFSLSS